MLPLKSYCLAAQPGSSTARSNPLPARSPTAQANSVPLAERGALPASRSQSVTNRTPGSPTFGIAEVRSLFQPYATPAFGSTSLARTRASSQGRARGSGARTSTERSWGQKFFCLSDPASQRVPSQEERRLLTAAGLGPELIDLRMWICN